MERERNEELIEAAFSTKDCSDLQAKLLATLKSYELRGSVFGDTLESEIIEVLRRYNAMLIGSILV